MTRELDSQIFPVYFAVWAMLALIYILHLRALSNPREKKKWSDRYAIIVGVFVAGTMSVTLFLRENYLPILPLVALGAWIIWRNLRGTFYCDSCGKRAYLASPSAPSFFCPSCGHKLK